MLAYHFALVVVDTTVVLVVLERSQERPLHDQKCHLCNKGTNDGCDGFDAWSVVLEWTASRYLGSGCHGRRNSNFNKLMTHRVDCPHVVGSCVLSPNYHVNQRPNQTWRIPFNSNETPHVDDLLYGEQFRQYVGRWKNLHMSVGSRSENRFWHKGWLICTEPLEIQMSAIGDPHVSTITGYLFDLQRTGGSLFVKIHLEVSEERDKLLVWNEVPLHGGSPCAPSYLQQVRINKSWLEVMWYLCIEDPSKVPAPSVLYARVAIPVF